MKPATLRTSGLWSREMQHDSGRRAGGPMGGRYLVLSHMTALRYWRLAATGLLPMPTRCGISDLSQATSSLRDMDSTRLDWLGIQPVDLAEHGIVPRKALEPGLAALARYGQIPTLQQLSAVVDSSANLAQRRRAVLHELVRIIRSMAIGRAGSHEQADATFALPRFDYTFPLPLDVLVGSRGARCPSSSVHSHCCLNPLPKGALWRINDSVYIVSPSFLLTQIAAAHPDAPHAVIAAGLELAGTYSLLPTGFVDCSKLIDEGRDFISNDGVLLGDGYARARQVLAPSDIAPASMNARYGRAACDAAAPYIVPGSATPLETCINVSLSPRNRLGGFSAGIPQLNTTVDLSPAAQTLYEDRRTCVLDALYVEGGRKVDVEPGGDAWHRFSWKQDNQRRRALEHDGYTVEVVTWDEFADFPRWCLVAESIVSRLGHKSSQPSALVRQRQALVHADLVNPDFLRESF